MNTVNKILLSTLLNMGLLSVAFAELPQISDARVVQPPPGAKVAAAYFTITNNTTVALEITDAKSEIAKKTEVHLSLVENDVAKMMKQTSVLVGAGESLDFTHGSFHVMFMGLKEDLVAGNSFDLILNTSAGDISVAMPIISLDEAMSDKDMAHEMGEAGDAMKKDMKESTHSEHDNKK